MEEQNIRERQVKRLVSTVFNPISSVFGSYLFSYAYFFIPITVHGIFGPRGSLLEKPKAPRGQCDTGLKIMVIQCYERSPTLWVYLHFNI